MSELSSRIEGAREHVQVRWTEERAREVERGMLRRRARRHRVGAALAAVATLAVLAIAGVLWLGPGKPAAPAAVASAAASASAPVAIRFDDGSAAVALDETTDMRAVSVTPQRVVVRIDRGQARFEVVPSPARVFRVEAGEVAVEVLGTSFTVERDQGRSHVAVERGRVRVSWADGVLELGRGEQGWFPRLGASPAVPAPPEPSPPSGAGPLSARPPTLPLPPTSVPAAKAAASSWRALARDGDYDRAYEALQREGAGARADQAADLLLEADVARLSRHPAQAVAPLRKLLSSHPGDPRAPLAAFTLGRVLLDDLGRPREAADAFARARAASPGGAMAEDALAREVEAWSRAGEATMARARAEEYVRRHPKGRREKLVRRLGGLEE